MTHKLVSKSARIVRQSLLIVGMVASLSISTNAETVKAMIRHQLTAHSWSPKPMARDAGIPGRTAVRRKE